MAGAQAVDRVDPTRPGLILLQNPHFGKGMAQGPGIEPDVHGFGIRHAPSAAPLVYPKCGKINFHKWGGIWWEMMESNHLACAATGLQPGPLPFGQFP